MNTDVPDVVMTDADAPMEPTTTNSSRRRMESIDRIAFEMIPISETTQENETNHTMGTDVRMEDACVDGVASIAPSGVIVPAESLSVEGAISIPLIPLDGNGQPRRSVKRPATNLLSQVTASNLRQRLTPFTLLELLTSDYDVVPILRDAAAAGFHVPLIEKLDQAIAADQPRRDMNGRQPTLYRVTSNSVGQLNSIDWSDDEMTTISDEPYRPRPRGRPKKHEQQRRQNAPLSLVGQIKSVAQAFDPTLSRPSGKLKQNAVNTATGQNEQPQRKKRGPKPKPKVSLTDSLLMVANAATNQQHATNLPAPSIPVSSVPAPSVTAITTDPQLPYKPRHTPSSSPPPTSNKITVDVDQLRGPTAARPTQGQERPAAAISSSDESSASRFPFLQVNENSIRFRKSDLPSFTMRKKKPKWVGWQEEKLSEPSPSPPVENTDDNTTDPPIPSFDELAAGLTMRQARFLHTAVTPTNILPGGRRSAHRPVVMPYDNVDWKGRSQAAKAEEK